MMWSISAIDLLGDLLVYEEMGKLNGAECFEKVECMSPPLKILSILSFNLAYTNLDLSAVTFFDFIWLTLLFSLPLFENWLIEAVPCFLPAFFSKPPRVMW